MEVLQYVPLSPTFCGSSQANRPPGLTVKPTAAKQFASAIRQHKKYAQGRQLGVKFGYRTCKTPSVVHRGHPCREILLEPCHRFVIALKRERKKIGSFSQSTSKKISPDLRRRNPNCRSSHPSSVVSKALKLRSATRLASFSLASGTGECHKGQSSRNLVNPQKFPFPSIEKGLCWCIPRVKLNSLSRTRKTFFWANTRQRRLMSGTPAVSFRQGLVPTYLVDLFPILDADIRT